MRGRDHVMKRAGNKGAGSASQKTVPHASVIVVCCTPSLSFDVRSRDQREIVHSDKDHTGIQISNEYPLSFTIKIRAFSRSRLTLD